MFKVQCRFIFNFTAFLIVVITIKAGASKNFDAQKPSWSQPKNNVVSFIRNKRATNFAVPVPPKPVQPWSIQKSVACTAPGGKAGHCKHISDCNDNSYHWNNPNMMGYMCVLNQQFVGVCCADEFLREGTSEFLPARSLAGPLPAITTEDDDAIIFPDSQIGTYNKQDSRVGGCGISPKNQAYTHGSKATNNHDWPWIAALLKYEPSSEDLSRFIWKQFCGGSLITDRHILTAAHCLLHKEAKDIRVRLGEYNLLYSNETRSIDFEVAEIITHPEYNHARLEYDITILKLKKPTVFNTYIWPICLPPPRVTFENKEGIILGWGTQEFGGAPSNVLMEVSVPVWPRELCIERHIQQIKRIHLCAGAKEGKGDACQQDSGGPLAHQLESGRWAVIGIVSWGIGCATPNRPGVYTRVNAFLEWIMNNTKI